MISAAPLTPDTEADDFPARRVHLIFHIPKCAGQTIHHHLSTYAPKGSYYRVRRRRGPSRLFFKKYALDGMPDTHGVRAIGGHCLGNSIERIFDGRHIERSILVRDPVTHFVAHYNFRMMRYISQGLRPYSLDLAYQARQRNFITHFILRNFLEMSWPRLMSLSAVEQYVTVNQFLSTFWFVGDYTRCDELLAALAPDLRVPPAGTIRNSCAQWQSRVQWKPLRVEDLTSRMIEQIRRDNVLDQLLWETWRDVEQARICMRSHEIHEMPFAEFVATESLRLVSQAKRRFQRGWNAPRGRGVAPAPAFPVPRMG